jgi:hypothetical protein
MSQRSRGQRALYSRPAARRMSSAESIVQRLTQREHSGNNLAVSVHQHFGYRTHYMWNGSFGSRSFERRLCSYKTVQDLFTDIFTRTFEGTCGCISVRDEFLAPDRLPLFDLWCNKIDICRVLLPLLPEWLDEDIRWVTVHMVREHLEHDVGASTAVVSLGPCRRSCIINNDKSFFCLVISD